MRVEAFGRPVQERDDGGDPAVRVKRQHVGAVSERRARCQLERTAAPELAELLAELEGYPAPESGAAAEEEAVGDLAVPMRMATDYGDLALLYTTTVFGSPRDVMLDEIAIATFYPADPATAELLRTMAG